MKDIHNDFLHLLQGLISKFSYSKILKEKLLSTKGYILCEATHSTIWGIGRDISRDGSNMWRDRRNWRTEGVGLMSLGLMIVREELLAKVHNSASSLIQNLSHIIKLPKPKALIDAGQTNARTSQSSPVPRDNLPLYSEILGDDSHSINENRSSLSPQPKINVQILNNQDYYHPPYAHDCT